MKNFMKFLITEIVTVVKLVKKDDNVPVIDYNQFKKYYQKKI